MTRGAAPLPDAFVERLRGQLGDDEAAAVAAALDTPGVRGLRVNAAKASLDEVCAAIDVPVDPVPWCADGTYVDGDGARRAGSSPAHAAGLYYLQEPSAMAVVEALAPGPGALVLDAAASPGGKSTHLASAIGRGGLVVANEVVRSRVGALLDNVERWGSPDVVITSSPVEALADAAAGIFDAVVVDAPCSGEAMFRKDDHARRAWSPAHVAGSARRQRQLLSSCASLVRGDGGGRLVYSTCTFNQDENEAVVDGFLASAEGWVVDRSERYWPHRCRCDGHTVIVLSRSGSDATPGRSVKISRALRHENLHRTERGALERFVDAEALDGAGRIVRRDDRLYLVAARAEELPGLPGLVRGGLPLGRLHAGQRFEPSHALALSTLPLSPTVEQVDLGDDAAARFLAGHVLEHDGEGGWVAVRWRSWRLGWAKRTAGRLKPRIPRRARTSG